MHRQTFLKLAASTTFAAGVKFAFPWAAAAATRPVSYAGSLWRSGGAGKIQRSTDGGRTWKLHSNLGRMYAINSLAVRNGRLYARLGYAGRPFTLVLAKDKRSWRTV